MPNHHGRSAEDLTIYPHFGRLTVLARAVNPSGIKVKWICQCTCGNICEVNAYSLKAGLTQSCGCLHKERLSERARRHGMKSTPEYRSWCSMKSRCLNPNNSAYMRYGGAGVTVHEPWIHSFEVFYGAMGPRQSPHHSLDRWPDPFGNYEPGNVRWATRLEQNRNKRMPMKRLKIAGINRPLVEWADQCGIPSKHILQRLANGWTAEDAMSIPVQAREPLVIDGEAKAASAWSRETGQTPQIISQRLKRGWKVKDAVYLPPTPKFHFITWHGETKRLIDWAHHLGLHPRTLRSRVRLGWSIDRAFTAPIRPRIHQ